MSLFKKKLTFIIPIVVEIDNDRFHAYCPVLKGLHAEGATKEEACKNGVDAAGAYLKSLIKHGDPIPLGIDVKEGEQQTAPVIPPSVKCIHQIPITV